MRYTDSKKSHAGKAWHGFPGARYQWQGGSPASLLTAHGGQRGLPSRNRYCRLGLAALTITHGTSLRCALVTEARGARKITLSSYGIAAKSFFAHAPKYASATPLSCARRLAAAFSSWCMSRLLMTALKCGFEISRTTFWIVVVLLLDDLALRSNHEAVCNA